MTPIDTGTLTMPKNASLLAIALTVVIAPLGCNTDSEKNNKKTDKRRSTNLVPPPTEITFEPENRTTNTGSTIPKVLLERHSEKIPDEVIDRISSSVSLETLEGEKINSTVSIESEDIKGLDHVYATSITIKPDDELNSRWYVLKIYDVPDDLRWPDKRPERYDLGDGSFGIKFHPESSPFVSAMFVCEKKDGKKVSVQFSEYMKIVLDKEVEDIVDLYVKTKNDDLDEKLMYSEGHVGVVVAPGVSMNNDDTVYLDVESGFVSKSEEIDLEPSSYQFTPSEAPTVGGCKSHRFPIPPEAP
jgi:hypothetical protein